MMTTTQRTQTEAEIAAFHAARRGHSDASSSDTTTEEQKKPSTAAQNKKGSPTEDKGALSQITPKVPNGEVAAGIPTGQMFSHAMNQLSNAVDLVVSTSNIDPALGAQFKEEVRSRVKELVAAAEADKREEALRRQTPTSTTHQGPQTSTPTESAYDAYLKRSSGH